MMNRILNKKVWLAILAVATLVGLVLANREPRAVVFRKDGSDPFPALWPVNIDLPVQTQRMLHANPERDATRAFDRGDLRFVAYHVHNSQHPLPEGLSWGKFGKSLEDFKNVAFATNNVGGEALSFFRDALYDYALRYNGRMLILRQGID